MIFPDSTPISFEIVIRYLTFLEENIDNILKASIPNKQQFCAASILSTQFFTDVRNLVSSGAEVNISHPSDSTVEMIEYLLCQPTVQSYLKQHGNIINWSAIEDLKPHLADKLPKYPAV